MALIVHRYKDIQIEAPWRIARSWTVSFTIPFSCVSSLTLSEDSSAKPLSPSSTVYITSNVCLPRVVLNSNSSAVVPAFFRWLPERACTSTGACAEVATASGACPLIQTSRTAIIQLGYHLITIFITTSLLSQRDVEAFVVCILLRPTPLRYRSHIVSNFYSAIDLQRARSRRTSPPNALSLFECPNRGLHCCVRIIFNR